MNREEIAQEEIGYTDIGPVSARTLVILFILMLVLVPGAQLLVWAATGFSPAASAQFPMLRSLALPARAVQGAVEVHAGVLLLKQGTTELCTIAGAGPQASLFRTSSAIVFNR